MTEIEKLVPAFLMADRNGRAIAKAIERAFQIVEAAAEEAYGIVTDPDLMPEWRLDERAGELNCVYDYNGTVEQKRYWIKNASKLYSVYGTPQAIYNFLEGYFQDVTVSEWFDYGGSPYHFRVTLSGEMTEERLAWARKAIAGVQNARSVLDDVTIDSSSEILISADTDYGFVDDLRAAVDQITGANDIEDWHDPSEVVAMTDVSLTDVGVTG